MRKLWIVILLGVVLGLTACGGEDDLPEDTAVPTAVTSPTRTPLPGTWTPSPEGFVATAAPSVAPPTTAPQASQVEGGQSLPVTWTPLPADYVPPSATPAPRLTSADAKETPETIRYGSPVPPGPTATPYPEVCATFEVTASDDRVFIGSATGLAWTPVEGAAGYAFVLRHQGGGIVIETVVTSTLFEIPAETFTVQGLYGWELVPVDAAGMPMCATVSNELFALFGE